MPRPNSYSVSDFKRNLQVAHSFNQGVAYMGALLFRLSSSAMVFWFVPTAANLIGQGEIVWWLYGDIPGIPVDAVDDGIVVGGGCTLLRLASKVDAIKDNLENDEEKVVMLLGTRNFNSKYILDVNCVVVEIIEHEPVPTGNPMDNSRNQDTIARRCRRL
ncbi:hypothetical protein RHGRI_023849 [Rhododendron griersonianum]|uniref:Uncharacterized protein n=1 Tax=Rhododendron griersonianum TaxID=479676 RepID=A0AAV6J730_9ERIC|nr:hypothetical protein RHGRI_023849 [Rhododendron griersonianum]